MSRSVFGWDLPPGCTQRHIDEACGSDAPCECCGHDPNDCICPECPTCKQIGDPACYKDGWHGDNVLKYSKQQLIGQTKQRISDMEVRLAEEKYALELMELSVE
jgi:hypothetical protein